MCQMLLKKPQKTSKESWQMDLKKTHKNSTTKTTQNNQTKKKRVSSEDAEVI